MVAEALHRRRELMMEGVESAQAEWGGMVAASNRIQPGMDGTVMLRAMCGDGLCPAPHPSHVVAGSLGVRYADGREEIIRAGEAFYLAPRHAPFRTELAEVVELTPAADFAALMERAATFLAQQQD